MTKTAKPRPEAPGADWALEQEAFSAANTEWSTEAYQDLIRRLWAAYCDMEQRAKTAGWPDEMTVAMEQVWRGAFLGQAHRRRGRGAAGLGRRSQHPDSCEAVAYRALRRFMAKRVTPAPSVDEAARGALAPTDG